MKRHHSFEEEDDKKKRRNLEQQQNHFDSSHQNQESDLYQHYFSRSTQEEAQKAFARIDINNQHQIVAQRHPLLQKILNAPNTFSSSSNQLNGLVDLTEEDSSLGNELNLQLRKAMDQTDVEKRMRQELDPILYCRYCSKETEKPVRIPCCSSIICRTCAHSLPPSIFACKICHKPFDKRFIEVVYILQPD
eukprot:TRINITY_DN2141_c0_g1_i2.p1 TRINITY_DN2141_c0_g1~~TRINITY_DN2141_c0_g1_i2.p1  ORF type:complete len:191 (+),score=46.22 TRINITY_DN2141_c0_g1_i2:179-751(+)